MNALASGIHLPRKENRALRGALLASIALHLLLLYALPDLRNARRTSVPREPLIARLLQPQSRVEPVASAAPVSEQARTPEGRPAAKSRPTARALLPEPPPPTRRDSSPAADLPASEPVATRQETAAPSATLQTAPAFAAQAASSPGDTLDPGTLAQYRLAIMSAARRYKRYPRAALDNNWQGRVEIRMVVGPNGAISGLSVRSSAGHEILDQQALEMIERAKALTQIPASLRGREFAVDIPVIFSLRDADA